MLICEYLRHLWVLSRLNVISAIAFIAHDIILPVRPSVRLSVCPTVCPLRYGNGARYCYSFFSPHGSAIILVLYQTSSRNSYGVNPCGGAKYRWGIQISRFSTNNSLYLANDTREPHSYCGALIGICIRSIKWCHFQRPWTNSNPVFKIIAFFYIEYLTNRYGYRYYRRKIGNRIQAFEWHQFQWFWVTSKLDFKVTIIFNVKQLD